GCCARTASGHAAAALPTSAMKPRRVRSSMGRRRRAVLSIYVRENEDDDTRASYLRKNLRLRILDYERVTRSFFTISMERDRIIYYSWCNFSVQRAIPCIVSSWYIRKEEKRAWEILW